MLPDNSLLPKGALATYRHKKIGGRPSLVPLARRSISCWYWRGGSTWHGPCMEPTRLLSLWLDSYTCTTTMPFWWLKAHTELLQPKLGALQTDDSILIFSVPLIALISAQLLSTLCFFDSLIFSDSNPCGQNNSWRQNVTLPFMLMCPVRQRVTNVKSSLS